MVYKGSGCIHCGNTGYRGRVAIHEVMPMTPRLRDLTVHRYSTAEIQRAAIEEGMQTMQRDGLDKAMKGLTTVSEVVRVAYEENGG